MKRCLIIILLYSITFAFNGKNMVEGSSEKISEDKISKNKIIYNKKNKKYNYKNLEKGFNEKKIYIVSKNDKIHDCLRIISYNLYGEEKLWPLIYMENRDKIIKASLIYPGQRLTIIPFNKKEKRIDKNIINIPKNIRTEFINAYNKAKNELRDVYIFFHKTEIENEDFYFWSVVKRDDKSGLYFYKYLVIKRNEFEKKMKELDKLVLIVSFEQTIKEE